MSGEGAWTEMDAERCWLRLEVHFVGKTELMGQEQRAEMPS